MPLFQEWEVLTPFGRIRLPTIDLPPRLTPKAPDDRAWQALFQALGEDLAAIPGAIPVVGSVIEDVLEDTHHREVLRLLTPDETRRFIEYEKGLPTTLAVARTLLF